MLERKPDILDAAADYQEKMIQAGVAAAVGTGVSLKKTGSCHNCGEHISELFCDADCRDDYEWRTERERANSKRA